MSNIHPIELKRRLRRLSRALNTRTTDINWGGCGVMAGIVGEILELWGIPVEVVTPDNYGYAPAEVRERLYWEFGSENDGRWGVRDWDNQGLCRWHLAVRFKLRDKVYTWDSDGLLCSERYFGRHHDGSPTRSADYVFGKGMTVQECIEISSTSEGWNIQFDRRQIPLLRELAYQHLQP